MAFSSLPLLFYNLGGEMLYVLDQRLVAQAIEREKSDKVMSDIVDAMFNVNSFQEMCKPQPLYPKDALKGIFKKIVHSSIMKVNADSMSKLYDLMIMSVKYQVLESNSAKELMHITLNHLDSVLKFVMSNAVVHEKVKFIYSQLVIMYGLMTNGQYILLRQALLSFLQGSNSKVSVYLSLKKQNDQGHFKIRKMGEISTESKMPGEIVLYRGGSQPTIQQFESGCDFSPSSMPCAVNASDDFNGIRCTKLGCNIYKEEHDLSVAASSSNFTRESRDSSRYAKAELGLLAQIIGSEKPKSDDVFELKLACFSADNSHSAPETSSSSGNVSAANDETQQCNVVNITPVKSGKEELSQILQDLTIDSASKKTTSLGEDLLSLMDS